MKEKPAAFLDRDGTIIVDKHYLNDPELIEFLPGAIEGLKLLQEQGFLLFIVTNQSGVARKMMSLDQVHSVHTRLDQLLAQEKIYIKDYAICPHHPDENCSCRKPSPKMILDLAQKYSIDLSKSLMAGDKNSDVESGERARVKSYLIGEKNLLDIVKEHLS